MSLTITNADLLTANKAASKAELSASSRLSRIQYRPDIEGLRGLAILMVVIFHTGAFWLSGGFVGVDVFFVLSGYLITSLLVSEISKTGTLNFLQFYARRARRLLPASVLMLIVTVLVALFAYSKFEQELLSRTARVTATYMSNIWFMLQASDYFASETATNPLLHTWSLAVEEQFYMIWPLLIFVACRGSQGRYRKGRLLIFLGLTSVASFGVFLLLNHINQPWAFFSSPARAWEFGVGAMVSFVSPQTVTSWRKGAGGMIWCGLAAVIAAAFVFTSNTRFFPLAVTVPVLGSAAVLVGGAGQRVNPILNSRILRWLGSLSYSWYLWHWPVFVVMLRYFPGMRWYGLTLLTIGSLGLAIVSHKVIEQRVRHSAYLISRPALSVGLAVALTVLVFGIAIAWQKECFRSAGYKEFAAARKDIPRIYTNGCHSDLRDSTPHPCVYGNPSSPTTIVLFGDSHAAQWFPAMESIANEHGWRLVTITHSACPAIYLPTFDPMLHRPVPECAAWREAAIRKILDMRPALIVTSLYSRYERLPGQRFSPLTWQKGSRKLFETFNAAALPLAVLGDSPYPGFDVPTCLSRLGMHQVRSCSTARKTAIISSVFQAEQAAAVGLNVSVLSTADQICGQETCDGRTGDGMIIFRDDNHLTGKFVEGLTPFLSAQIVPLLR